MLLTDNITNIKGIGDKTASLFAKASVFCVKDLLLYFPRNYIEYPDITKIADAKKGCINCFNGRVVSVPSLFSSKGKTILSFEIADDSGKIKVYYFNMPYLKNTIKSGMQVTMYGVIPYESKINMLSNPKMCTKDEYLELKKAPVPLYPLVKGLSNNKILDALKKVLSSDIVFEDFVDETTRQENDLCTVDEAIRLIHFPNEYNDVLKARRRLAFNEFFVLLYNMKKIKGDNTKNATDHIIGMDENTKSFIKSLPYELTKGQLCAVDEITKDMCSGYSMNRLLQGDVGSGKTIVAFIACLNAHALHKQSAVMAPTVVLAMQHYLDFKDMSDRYNLDLNIVLLTGTMKASERKAALSSIKSGEADIIVGTHALITDKVEYNNLALSIVDEQHRFGVKQRFSLLNKGKDMHLLVMSATPIPRTLGLILYGDMDISTIKEKPSNRLPLKNAVVGPAFRPKNYHFIQDEINKGHQAYIICPMVEEGDMQGLKNVETYPDEIREYFDSKVRILSLHGKMKDSEKDEIMLAFKNHEADILVSTTVVEVGVNVPNSTVIMIENADRFGLSQLHQLRGRVGRGEWQSYAIFVTENESKDNMERLSLLSKSNDGFFIAEEDLKRRGPGDFFGYRQSGDPAFKIADIYTDSQLLALAKKLVDNGVIQIHSKEDDITRHGFENYLDFGIICL